MPLLPTDILQVIASFELTSDESELDLHYWGGTSSGRFSIKSALHIIRNEDLLAHEPIWGVI